MATATKSKVDEKQMLIGGSRQGSSDGKTFESLDPANGEPLATVPEATAKDVDAAVAAARTAFESERVVGPAPGGPRQDALASRRADRREHGRARQSSRRAIRASRSGSRRSVIPGVAEHFRYYAGWVTKIEGETPPVSIPGRLPLHAARADRRLRADHPLELPDQHRELEDRPGTRLRQHGGDQAGGAGPAHHDPAGRADPGGGRPRWRAQRRHRRPRGRAGARQSRRRRQDLLHRFDRGRPLRSSAPPPAT